MEDNLKRNIIDPRIDTAGISKVTVSDRFTRVQIPTNIAKVLKIKEYFKKGERTYVTYRIKNGEIILLFTDENGIELYGKRDD